jgi:hypothetical protein
MELLDRAMGMGATPETLKQLMDLQERHEASQARKAFDEALSAAKSEIPVISKNRVVNYEHNSGGGMTSYRHEDLGEIARTVDPILSKHGLSYRFRTNSAPNEPISVTCIVSHRLGHSEENTLSAGRDDSGKKNQIQQMGSTITYLQRYTLKAALGLAAAADDDGASAEIDAITDEQAQAFRKMCDDLNGDEKKLCAHVGAEDVESMTPRQLKKATSTLNAWARKQREKAGA